MKLTAVFMLTACITVSAGTYGQSVSLSVKKVSLGRLFNMLEKQTGYSFLYSREDVHQLEAVDLQLNGADMATALRAAFRDQPLTYSIVDKVVIVKRKPVTYAPPATMEALKPVVLEIGGTITDNEGTPLPGASIQIKGTKRTAVSDAVGKFVISADAGDVLVIRYVGFSEKEVKVGPETTLTIKLEQLPSRLQGVSIVSTGYATLSKERAAGSFSNIGAKDLENKMQANLTERLEGMAAGFTYYKGDAQIRGVSTIRAEKAPLYVVDGMPFEGNINAINPNDVSSVTMLKDASAASIYGARAANGVIVIITKNGKPGPLSVNYTNSFKVTPLPDRGYMNRMSSAELVNFQRDIFQYWSNDPAGLDQRRFINDVYGLMYAHKAGNLTDAELENELEKYRHLDRYGQVKDEFLRNMALVQQHNLSLSGGTEKHRYNLSVNYLKNNPYEKIQSNDRFGYNLKNMFNLNKWLRLDVGVMGSHTRAEYDNGFNGYSNLNGGRASYYMIRNADGTPAQWYGQKSQFEIDRLIARGSLDETMFPLNEVSQQHYINKSNYLNLNVGGNIRLMQGLSLDVRYQSERTEGLSSQLYRPGSNYVKTMVNDATTSTGGIDTMWIPNGGQFSEARTALNSYTLRAQLNFNKIFNRDHEVSFIAGAERRRILSTGTDIYKYGYDEFSLVYKPIDESKLGRPLQKTQSVFNNFNYSRKERGFTEVENRFVSFYGNGSYTYRKRWTASGSIRMDQSNLFGTDPKYQYRPLWSAGLLYVVSENDLPWLNRLAVRGTYGVNGNIAKDAGPYMITRDETNPHYYTNELQASVASPPNSGLRWEKTNVVNFGIDFNVLNGRLTGSMDFYNKNSNDLLGNLQSDPTIGWSTILVNYGEMYNRGVDVSLTSENIRTKDLRWSSTFNFNYNKNELTNLYISANDVSSYVTSAQNRLGVPMQSLYSIRYAGLNDQGRPQAFTKDGKIVMDASQLTVDDLVYSGTMVPPYSASLLNNIRFKNFELFAMFMYYGGHKMRDVVAPFLTRLPELNYTTNMDRNALNYWKKPGDEANPDMSPAFISQPSSNVSMVYEAADKHVANASYIKLRDVTLSYNLPSALLQKAKVKALRISFQVQNVWRWSANSQKLDPEVWSGSGLGSASRGILLPPSYTLGLNLNL
ncbi:SusC/RagA family TonB-linked outer membrane protein [Chitinophaga sp.]|uniref:SusC/RagA family TonB-linked outer membrane protein n=1 Tax=Chitinophaga sp. TaxID=1869181 RepID=UPI00260EF8F6|nr:SusC/RagA family TonB-linked outer membrane protein [uncultured Chitinophaga sp.]